MANILKKIEGVVYMPETSAQQINGDAIKNEIIDNIEDLSKEVNYMKEKVKILVSADNDPEEVTDTIFKLRDLQASMEGRKQHWEQLISHMDITIRQDTLNAMDMLKSTTENLENMLEQVQKI